MRENIEIEPVAEDGLRQFINARASFEALEQAVRRARDFRGSMIWRKSGGHEYLVRTLPNSSQKGLGRRGPETEAIYAKFMRGKADVQERLRLLRDRVDTERKLNRALAVGRTPDLLVDLLNHLEASSMAEHFIVIGTNALYAYETAAGVRVDSAQLATRDYDLLWDNRKHIRLGVQQEALSEGFLGLLKRLDKTFELRADQLYTAVNAKGIEVDLLRRMGPGSEHEAQRLSNQDDDFWAVKARNADWLLSAPKFTQIIVGTSGRMARMRTIDPRAFALFKLWMARQKDRDPIKRKRDVTQAAAVVEIINQHLPMLSFEDIKVFPVDVAALIDSSGEAARIKPSGS